MFFFFFLFTIFISKHQISKCSFWWAVRGSFLYVKLCFCKVSWCLVKLLRKIVVRFYLHCFMLNFICNGFCINLPIVVSRRLFPDNNIWALTLLWCLIRLSSENVWVMASWNHMDSFSVFADDGVVLYFVNAFITISWFIYWCCLANKDIVLSCLVFLFSFVWIDDISFL